MMKKILSILLAAGMCLSMAACASVDSTSNDSSTADNNSSTQESESQEETAESDVEYIKDKGTLVVGITEFAPMDYKDDNGEWIGFDADMAKEIADALGVEVQFTVIEWGNKLLELENKSIDCAWNGMTITDEITEGASATNPYAKNAQVVVVKKDVADQYTTAESLQGLLVAVEDGSAGQEAAQAEGLDTNDVLDQATALMEVNSGTSDACVIDLLMAGAMIGEGTSYPDLVTTVELTTEDYGVGCRKGSDLTDFINEQFVKLYEDGTMMELAEKYGIKDNIVEQK